MNQPESDTTIDSSSVAQDGQLLDLTAESSQISAVTAPSVGQKYDPRPHEDTARRNLAYALVGILALLVVCILILVAFGSVEVSKTPNS